MYIPLTSKLSLYKNKKKRVDKPKPSVFDDNNEEYAHKVTKISEDVPDQYVIAARGYAASEVVDANIMLKAL